MMTTKTKKKMRGSLHEENDGDAMMMMQSDVEHQKSHSVLLEHKGVEGEFSEVDSCDHGEERHRGDAPSVFVRRASSSSSSRDDDKNDDEEKEDLQRRDQEYRQQNSRA